MKRVIIGAFVGVIFFVFAHRQASAMAEFCPAELIYQAVGQSEDSPLPSELYAFELTALGPRVVTSSRLAFDTSDGWFTVSVPAVALAQKNRHYDGPNGTMTRHDYVSQVMYAKFAGPVTIQHAWVYDATATGDEFGWQARGTVQCDPRGTPSGDRQRGIPFGIDRTFVLEPADDDHLSDPPSNTSTIFTPTVSKALENGSCSEPFREATVKKQAQPQFPFGAAGMLSGRATTSVMVAVDGEGNVRDAWLWASSGYAPLDEASLAAAKASTFIDARAYCRPVPGKYKFVMIFDPSG